MKLTIKRHQLYMIDMKRCLIDEADGTSVSGAGHQPVNGGTEVRGQVGHKTKSRRSKGLFIILSEFELSLVSLKLKLHFNFIWDHELLLF